MKKIIFTLIPIFIFCRSVCAQTDENTCRKIIITAPASVQAETEFNVSAHFEKETASSRAQFDWTIIKSAEVTKNYAAGMIKINSQGIKNAGRQITVLADSTDARCQNTAAAVEIFVEPPCGLPMMIDEYGKMNWRDESARLENAAIQMQQISDQKLYISYSFDKTLRPRVKNHLIKVLNYLSEKGKLKKNRVVFLLNEADAEETKLQPLPESFESSACHDCILIKGENLEKLAEIFQIQTPNKISKNKKL